MPTTWSISSNNTKAPASPAIKLTFVRHGSTDWNRDRRFQGQSDVPLNAEGRAQAQSLARALRGERFDHAVSSDLSRAFDTARAIRGGAFVEADSRWREFAFGAWEGLTWEQIVERNPELREHGVAAARLYSPPGGEAFAQVCERVRDAIASLRQRGLQNVLVVTHAGALHAMLHVLFGERRADFEEVFGVRFAPASVTRVALNEDGWKLLGLNDYE